MQNKLTWIPLYKPTEECQLTLQTIKWMQFSSAVTETSKGNSYFRFPKKTRTKRPNAENCSFSSNWTQFSAKKLLAAVSHSVLSIQRQWGSKMAAAEKHGLPSEMTQVLSCWGSYSWQTDFSKPLSLCKSATASWASRVKCFYALLGNRSWVWIIYLLLRQLSTTESLLRRQGEHVMFCNLCQLDHVWVHLSICYIL